MRNTLRHTPKKNLLENIINVTSKRKQYRRSSPSDSYSLVNEKNEGMLLRKPAQVKCRKLLNITENSCRSPPSRSKQLYNSRVALGVVLASSGVIISRSKYSGLGLNPICHAREYDGVIYSSRNRRKCLSTITLCRMNSINCLIKQGKESKLDVRVCLGARSIATTTNTASTEI